MSADVTALSAVRADRVERAALRAERVAYFVAVMDDEHPTELRYRVSDRDWRKAWVTTPQEADERAHELTTAGHDVYVGMAPRIGFTGPRATMYAPSRVLWVDCDAARAVHALDLFEPQPTIRVLSGGIDAGVAKTHAVWWLRRPLPADDVKRHNQRLQHHLGADAQSVDAARVLRVPGSRHHGTGRIARLASFTGEMHDLHDLTGDLDDAPGYRRAGEARPAKTDDELVALFCATHVEGHRHEAFRSVCGVLLRNCDRLAPDALLELALSWAHDHLRPCRADAELTRQFDNLLDRERARRGIA